MDARNGRVGFRNDRFRLLHSHVGVCYVRRELVGVPSLMESAVDRSDLACNDEMDDEM